MRPGTHRPHAEKGRDNQDMRWLRVLLAALGPTLMAAPPGATLQQKLIVPAALRNGIFASDHNITLPPGFTLSVWARVPDARFLGLAPNGDVFVSSPDSGRVTLLRPDRNGAVPGQSTWVSGLKQPHGLAFDNVNGTTFLYVAETDQVDRYVYDSAASVAPKADVIIRGLPSGGNHPLKSIAVAPDHSLYVGLGSSCNACASDTTAAIVRGSVYRFNPDGSGMQLFAQGLRNPEGLAFLPGTGQLWAAVNNRDDIVYPRQDSTGQYGKVVRAFVDDNPPEPVTSVRPGGNYGWPFCNSAQDSSSGLSNMPFDPDYELNRDGHVDCSKMDRMSKGIQAHSAPLGFHFLQGTTFATPYRNGAVIALHGSWDRSQPTGYKVIWLPWNPITNAPGDPIDLVSGFSGFGRPVDTLAIPDGSLLITDDSSGTIYRLEWAPAAVSSASGFGMIAPGSYASLYSTSPLPVSGDFSLNVTDGNGRVARAAISYASPNQINFIVPGGLADGTARLSLNSGATATDLGAPEIRSVAPGLFTLSADGNGPAAVVALDDKGQVLSSDPIVLSKGRVFVSLYGTGIRNANSSDVQVLVNDAPVPVLYAGAQPTYPALDQINIELPADLAGSGTVTVVVSINGITSNVAELKIK